MSIIPDTIRKQKEYIADSNGNHTLVSRWTSAETVEMPNGDTLDQYSFADEKVKQTIDDDSNTAFDVLFSESSANVTSTEGTKKTSKFRYVPSSGDIILTNGGNGDNSRTAIVSPSDVALFGTDNTWDGTHTSLKQAVTAAASSGGVSDVRVNGVSKVVDHVAQIKSYKVVTQAEYDALDNPETDVMYCIRDASVSDGSLSNLVDVDIETPSSGQILKYDSVNRKWANEDETTYSDFDGSTHGLVPPVSTQAGKYLKDDGTWGTPSGVSTLEALTDVTITTPSSGQVLKYDATNNVWVNDTDSGANDAVTQTATDSTDAIYEVLFSNTADNTTRTEGARKSSNLTYNPSDKCLSIKEIETQEGVDYESYMDMYPDTIAMIDELKSSAIMISINSDGGHYYMSNGNNNTALSVDTNDIRLLGTGDTWDGTHTSLKDAIAASGGGGVSDLDDLGDVNISNPTSGQVLTYDATNDEWINTNGGGGGSNVRELSKSEYNALPTYEKNNGTLYLINGRTGVTDQITNIEISEYIESHSVCENTVSQDGTSVVSEWFGGSQIGNDFWITDKIDVTNYAYLRYNLELGTCYGTSSSSWYYTVGLMPSVPSDWIYAGDSRYVVKNSYTNQSVSYTDETLDVSNLTGEYYIIVVAHGWNATLSNIRLVTINALPNSIYYKSVEFANNQVPIELTQSEYDNLDTTAKCNGSIYFVKPSNSGFNKICYMGETYGENTEMLNKNILVMNKQDMVPNYGTYTNTYTATKDCYILAFNQVVHEEASTHTVTATFTSTGIQIATSFVENNSWSSPDRVHATRLSVYELKSGQTITFTNTCQATSNAMAIHFALMLDERLASRINSITNLKSYVKTDNVIQETINNEELSASGLYLVISTSRNNGTGTGAEIDCFTDGASAVRTVAKYVSYSASYALLTVNAQATVGMTYCRVSNYSHCGYQIYKLS